MSLFDTRIAQALGWTEEQVKGFSLRALRELLPEGKLKHDVTQAIQTGSYILQENYQTEQQARRVRRALTRRTKGQL